MSQKVLVADDEPHVRRLLTQQMQQCGFDVSEAANGNEAIAMMKEDSFDLLIVDIVMPDKDGLEVIMFMEEHRPETRIIAVSAPGNELYLTSAKGLGASRVFQKPFSLSEITDAAKELLGQT